MGSEHGGENERHGAQNGEIHRREKIASSALLAPGQEGKAIDFNHALLPVRGTCMDSKTAPESLDICPWLRHLDGFISVWNSFRFMAYVEVHELGKKHGVTGRGRCSTEGLNLVLT